MGWREIGLRVLAALQRYVRVITKGDDAAIVAFARVTAVPMEGARVVVRWRTRGVWRVRLRPGGDLLPPSGEISLLLPADGLSIRLSAWGAYSRLERELHLRPADVPGTGRRIELVTRSRAVTSTRTVSIAVRARRVVAALARHTTRVKPSPLVVARRVRYVGRHVVVARPWLRAAPAEFLSDVID